MGSEERVDRNGIRYPRPCRSYASGHGVHHIQWNKARRDPDTQTPAQVVDVGDEFVSILLDGEVVDLRHHDLERVALLVDRFGDDLVAQLRWKVIWIGDYLISVRRSNPLDPCSDEQAGGATVAATSPGETAAQLVRVTQR